jgi:Dipeptidyl aminopeptidases/acylaminoacyl-peptidases
MSRFLLILLLISLSACAPQPTPTAVIELTQTQSLQSQIAVPSDWAGAISHSDGTTESITIHFDETKGILNIEPKVKTYEFENIERLDSKISFKVTTENEMTFSGTYDGSQITGQVEENGQTDSFTLLPLSSETKDSLNAFPGTYQFESGESVLINLAPEYTSSGLYFFGQGLMVTRFGTGAIRALYPIATDTFLVGSARAIGYPFKEQITFQRDSNGNVSGLTLQTRNPETGELGESQSAKRIILKSEVVHFTSEDGTNLTGLLTLPATSGPYPAIMSLHGSEPGTKDNFGSQQTSAFMASHGIAVLTYDKRGVGESEGSYVEAATERNLNLIAQDAIAGVEYLKARPEIKADQIGLTGFSQAGWVIPLAASGSKDIAYFIILSGPVTSVGHEDLFSTYTNDGESANNYSQEVIAKRLADTPPSGFDSTPIIANLDQLGLWIWGDQDKSQPAFESENNLKEIIAQGKSNFSYVMLVDADHNLQQTTQGLFNEIPYSAGYHPDYYKTILEWLSKNKFR